jgi:hypothetical protein
MATTYKSPKKPKKKLTKLASATLKESIALKKQARKKGKEVATGGEHKTVFIQAGYELVVGRKSSLKKTIQQHDVLNSLDRKPAARPKVSVVKDNKRKRDETSPCVKTFRSQRRN